MRDFCLWKTQHRAACPEALVVYHNQTLVLLLRKILALMVQPVPDDLLTVTEYEPPASPTLSGPLIV